MAVNFGKTTKGGDFYSYGTNGPGICKYQSDEATTIQSITIYVKYGTSNANMQCAIYDSSYNLLANGTTEEKQITSAQDGWVTFTFSTPPSVSASTDYWLAWWANQTILIYYDSGSTDQRAAGINVVYNNWPNPLVLYEYAYDDAVSIWALGIPVLSVNDTVTVTDVLTDIIRGNARDISVNDSTSLSESLNIIVLSITVNDSVTVSESVVVSMPSIAVQEWVKATLVCKINVNDSVTVSESVSLPVLLVNVNVNDTISIAEAITSVSFLADISVSDAIALAESISLIDNLAEISVYDTVSILEKVYFEWWQGVVEPIPDWTDIEPDATPWTDLEPAETAWTDV